MLVPKHNWSNSRLFFNQSLCWNVQASGVELQYSPKPLHSSIFFSFCLYLLQQIVYRSCTGVSFLGEEVAFLGNGTNFCQVKKKNSIEMHIARLWSESNVVFWRNYITIGMFNFCYQGVNKRWNKLKLNSSEILLYWHYSVFTLLILY